MIRKTSQKYKKPENRKVREFYISRQKWLSVLFLHNRNNQIFDKDAELFVCNPCTPTLQMGIEYIANAYSQALTAKLKKRKPEKIAD